MGEILKERKERSSIGELISVTINNGVVKADSLERKDNSSSDKSNYKVVCKGDIAYNSMRMWQGASGYSPYNGILSPAYTVLIPTEKVDSKFISYMFKKEKMLQQFQKYSQGLTSDTWNLKYPMLKDIPVLFPKIDEQVSIRKHLDNISSLIALHQRKLEHLQEQKKGLLQKMFPKNGETVPEVRFPGFTDAWEQRKLGETSKITAGGDVDKEKLLTHGKYPVIANALTNDGIVGYYNDAYRITAPAVTVTGRGEIGKAKSRKINFTPVVRLLSVESKHNVDFLAEAINRSKVVFESTGVPQLTVPKLSNYKISFPVSENEETKIGDFIQQFDSLIALHQRKLDHLELMKKGLLQQMFV